MVLLVKYSFVQLWKFIPFGGAGILGIEPHAYQACSTAKISLINKTCNCLNKYTLLYFKLYIKLAGNFAFNKSSNLSIKIEESILCGTQSFYRENDPIISIISWHFGTTGSLHMVERASVLQWLPSIKGSQRSFKKEFEMSNFFKMSKVVLKNKINSITVLLDYGI